MDNAMKTIKFIAIIFCMIFTIVIWATICDEWQDYKRNMSKSPLERIKSNTSYIEKNQSVAIPADGYLAFSNKDGTDIIIVDPKKLYFVDGKQRITRR